MQYIEEDQVVTLVIPDVKINAKPGGGGTQPVESKPYGISRVNGGVTYTGNNKVWIIDTGIDFDHPDLNVNTNSLSSGE